MTTPAQAIDFAIRKQLRAEREAAAAGADPPPMLSEVRVTHGDVAAVVGENAKSWRSWVAGKPTSTGRAEGWADAAGLVLSRYPGDTWVAKPLPEER